MTKELKTAVITDNLGYKHTVIIDLKIGDKVKCIQGKSGLCDGGTFTLRFEGERLIKDKIYEVCHIGEWGWRMIPRVMDEDGCLEWLNVKYFELT